MEKTWKEAIVPSSKKLSLHLPGELIKMTKHLASVAARWFEICNERLPEDETEV
jgi:hypothetical protein